MRDVAIRILQRAWRAATFDQSLAEEIQDEPSTTTDGLILAAAVGALVAGVTTFHWVPPLLAIPAAPLTAIGLAVVAAGTIRMNEGRLSVGEMAAALSLAALPVVVGIVPLVGGVIAAIWWLLAAISLVRHITLMRLDNVAVALLLAVAVFVGIVIAMGAVATLIW